MPSAERGRAGEEYAAGVLAGMGYRILGRNVRSRYGEVDIVAEKGGVLCFVEVKTRRRGAQVSGAAAVGTAKQRKILKTALTYLQENPGNDRQPRFDLFVVETDGRGAVLGHDHLEGAFDGEAYGE